MMKVCITGGIGSGKSVVCRIFSSLGIPVYDADSAAKDLYDKYPEVIQKVKEQVSSEVFDKNGKINRKKLADVVFNDAEKLSVLNSITHPLVQWDYDNWSDAHRGFPYIVKEAAILFESGAHQGCDKIITVVSTPELRLARLRERDKRTKQEVEAIMQRQISDEEKITKSDFVIYNDEKQMLIPQVIKIHEELVRMSPSLMISK